MPVSEPITDQGVHVNEHDTWFYDTILLNEDGDPIPLASVVSLTLTLYAVCKPNEFINGRDHDDVLNVKGGTLDTDTGEFTMEFATADNAIVDTSLAAGKMEKHIALFQVIYSGDKVKNEQVEIWVKALEHVP